MRPMTKTELLSHMRSLLACEDAQEWVRSTPGSPAALWAACPRGDWMLWLAGAAEVDRKLLVLAACDCARTALRYVPAGEDRPKLAIETTEAWCRGEATIEQVRTARSDAAAAYAAYAASAAAAVAYADAAYAAAYAAYAASAAADGAAAAAYAAAAYAAAYAAAAADGAAAAAKARRRCARLVAARIPWSAVEAGLRGAR